MELREVPVGPVTRVQIARYACAVGDFNPMHLDDEHARSAGMPSVIAHGPLTAALLLDAVVRQVGADALSGADIRFTLPVFPGEKLVVVPTEGGAELRKADGSVAAKATLTGGAA